MRPESKDDARVTREQGEPDVAWLAGVRLVWTLGDLVEPPVWIRQRARRLFRSHRAAGDRPTLVSRIRATLIFDSRRQGLGAAAGVRSGTVLGGTRPGPWQLLYRSGDVDIDLFVRPNQDGRTMNVRGQALSLGTTSIGTGVVEALLTEQTRAQPSEPPDPVRSAVELSGEFALTNLERGRYDVFLRFGTRQIELNDVEL
jgi:hypothetical protein